MTYSNQVILERIAKIDKSNWANKSISLIQDIPNRWYPDAPYSLKRATSDKNINLLDAYLAIGDPTEYEFAKQVFGSYRLWLKVRDSYWGKKIFPMYKIELSLKLKSEAVKGIIVIADDIETKETTKLQAVKFIVAGGWGEDPKPKKKQAAVEKEEIRNSVAEDIARIGLKVIK